ncbi:hypothetical protein LSH36_61g12006 [Paralvinella palmiformis]|uniref:Globin domain-containing protein n=2 Tax=Polychaeta TaxID=6341 RepID=A0AAD9NDK0_9ANNE|nr:hypothetical protein LSH36_61g12006 [Paralvinella palmiformis]
MGLSDNIAAVKGDVSTHAMNIFVEFFKKFPQHQTVFADYKGKDPDSLKSMPKFKTHTTKVVSKLLEVIEKSGDAGSFTSACTVLAKMPQHKGLNQQQFSDLGVVLMPYLQKTLGGACDSGAWEQAYNSLVSNVGPQL